MAEPVVYNIGEVVGYKNSICMIEGIIKTSHGYNVYKLLDVDTNSYNIAHKHQLLKATELHMFSDSFTEQECHQDEFVENETESEEVVKPVEPNSRFAALSAQDLDGIAAARISKNTDIQTKWGLKIFRGKTEAWIHCNKNCLSNEIIKNNSKQNIFIIVV